MECIAVINQKGGVGKTTTAVNLGAALGQRGRRVLLLDMDPQGHLTTHLGLDTAASGSSIHEVLTDSLPLASAIHTHSPMVSVVPAQIDLAAAETELVSVVGREMILRDALASNDGPYDTALIDCPPSLGLLTLNALCAATQVLIPVQPHFLALQGVGKLFKTIALVAQRINQRLRVAGVVICMNEPGTRLCGEVVEDISSFLESSRNSAVPWRDAQVMATRIRRNIKLAECPSYGQSILDYAPRSHGAEDYLALADEVLRSFPGLSDTTEPSGQDEATGGPGDQGKNGLLLGPPAPRSPEPPVLSPQQDRGTKGPARSGQLSAVSLQPERKGLPAGGPASLD